MAQARAWVFTINNYTVDDINSLDENKINYSYVVYGLEIGANGTPHIQGYIEFNNGKRLTTLAKAFPRAHWEKRKGTAKQAADYCKKGDEWVEHGKIKHQGARNDLDRIRQIAKEGGMRAVTLEGKNMNEIRLAQAYLTYHEEPRNWKPEVIWICGPTGYGKSKRAREICEGQESETFTKNDGTKWYDGYDGHQNVIFDDFRPSWFSCTETLSLLDRYEKRVEVKGGMRQFKPKRIIVTSILHPSQCYINVGEPVQQLLRRIDTIIDMTPAVTEVDATQVGVIVEAPLV